MTKPGNKSGQDGSMVPLGGGFEIKSKSTGDYDVLTITAPSTFDAYPINCRTNVAEGSSLHSGYDVFNISTNGTMTFAGFAGSSAMPTTAPNGYMIGTSGSGNIYGFPALSTGAANIGASVGQVILPQPFAGGQYTFIFQSTCTSTATFLFRTSAADKMVINGGKYDALEVWGNSAAGDAGGLIVRVISDGTYWYPMVNMELCDSNGAQVTATS